MPVLHPNDFRPGPSAAGLRLGRRGFLQLVGLAAAVGPILAGRAHAQAAGAAAPRMMDDGSLALTTGFVFPDAPPDALAAAFDSADPNLPLAVPCTVPVLRLGDRTILFDAGSGPMFMDSAGRLAASLEAAGISPADVTDVVFTHFHPDHLWGVTDDFDELTFPEAQYHMAQAEFDFWMAEDAVSNVDAGMETFVAGARSRLPRLAERGRFFKDGDEPLPGIEVAATPGHSPGHCSFLLHLGGDPLLITGDVFSHPLTIAHPQWRWGTDQDHDAAAAQRHRMIDRAISEKLRLAVFHMPAPGLGRIERGAEGARWVVEP
ncbi:MBL fold metallo-hydrolase [Paracoccus thiocyanatus]|uniref:MBL fold metallo-hydrolase n=1 Tax=Paracoccus thiocyanatus TaxID=34006 RepID=UPI0015F27668|nr:MBL fold metallo-hydrolase [Paracoccus thiocyanatus]